MSALDGEFSSVCERKVKKRRFMKGLFAGRY